MINSNDYYKKKYLKYKEKYLKYKEKNSLQQHGGSIATLATITFVCFMYIYSNTTQKIEIVELRSSKPPTLSALEQFLEPNDFGIVGTLLGNIGFVNNNLLLQKKNVEEIFKILKKINDINSEIPSNPNNVLVCTDPNDPSDPSNPNDPIMTCKTDNPSKGNLFKNLARHPHKTVVITRDGFPSGIKYHVFNIDLNRTNIRIESIPGISSSLYSNQVTEPTNAPFISTFPKKISEARSYLSSEVGKNLNVDQLKKAGSYAIRNTASAISDAGSYLSNEVGKNLNVTQISEAVSNIGNSGSSVISEAASSISDAGSYLSNEVSNTASAIGKNLNVTQISEAVSNIGKSGSSAISEATSSISKTASEVLNNMGLDLGKIQIIGKKSFISWFERDKTASEVESNKNLYDDEEDDKVVTKEGRIIDVINSMPNATIIKNPFFNPFFIENPFLLYLDTETHWVTTARYPDHYLVIYDAAFINKQKITKSVCIFQESNNDELIFCSVEKTVQSRKTVGNLLDGIYTTIDSLFFYLGIIKRLPIYLVFGDGAKTDRCKLPMIELVSNNIKLPKLEEIRKNVLEICQQENQPQSSIDGDSFFESIDENP